MGDSLGRSREEGEKAFFSSPTLLLLLKVLLRQKVAKRPFNTPVFPAFCKGKNGQSFKKKKTQKQLIDFA